MHVTVKAKVQNKVRHRGRRAHENPLRTWKTGTPQRCVVNRECIWTEASFRKGARPSSIASCKFEVERLLVVPGLVFGPKPDVRLNDVDGAMARNQPLTLRVGEHDKATTVGPTVAVRHCTGAAQWRHAVCRPWDAGVIEGRFNRRGTALSIEVSSGSSRSTALSKSPVSTTALSSEQRSRMSSNNAMHTDRLFGAFIIDINVSDREIRARRVGSSAELASDTMPSTAREAYVRVHGICNAVREKSRAKVFLLRSTAQWCWLAMWKFSSRNCRSRSLPSPGRK